MSEIIFMRDDGDDGIELTSIDDAGAIPYVRADCTGNILVREKRDLFIGGNDRNDGMRVPCDTCKHHDGDQFDYPCGACKHG